MDDVTPHDALDATEGELPRPEFVEALGRELRQELAAQSDGTRTVTPDVSIIDTVLEPEMEQTMDRTKRLWAIVGAAAAIIIVIVGIVVITADDDADNTNIGAVDQPDPTTAGTAGVATTEPPPPPTTEPVVTDPPAPSWDFDITYIEVPAGNSVAADAESAWVASPTGTLSKIDLATNAVVATYEIPTGANGTYFGFGTVWIGNGDGTVSRFDPGSETVTETIEVGGFPNWVEAGSDSMWAGNGLGGEAVRIDPGSNSVIARIDLAGSAGAIKQNSDGVWIRDSAGLVSRIDPETNLITATIETASGGGPMMASPGAVWAPGGISGTVYRIDPTTNSVTQEVDVSAAVGEPVTMFGIHYAGDTIWVRYARNCDAGDCTTQGVARIDPETDEVVAFQDLRDGWTQGGMNVGPTTAWTFTGDAVARFDFES